MHSGPGWGSSVRNNALLSAYLMCFMWEGDLSDGTPNGYLFAYFSIKSV
jgi:hypothetical protein